MEGNAHLLQVIRKMRSQINKLERENRALRGELQSFQRNEAVPGTCQGKVKAVSFLLPMDMSSYAEKQDSLKSPQNQSTKQLTTIAEKDM
ncbi:putative coiled-coil domain-containing protein 195 [Grus japonensis]|uniref:Coiled-coil domain-containing protein 195 n=1 Tax=Grus japonensis TaxID=30415 RepID=A0ABC9X774_GRUJA